MRRRAGALVAVGAPVAAMIVAVEAVGIVAAGPASVLADALAPAFVGSDDAHAKLFPPELCTWLKHEHEGEEGEDHH